VAITDDDKLFALPPAVLAELDAHGAGLGAKLQEFIRKECKRIGVFRRRTSEQIHLKGSANRLLAAINLADGRVYFSLPGEPLASRVERFNRYVDECKALTGEGTASVQLSLLLQKPELWAAAMEKVLNSVRSR
jgi:hypothetical protein